MPPKEPSIYDLILSQLDKFSDKMEGVDDKIERVSSNLEFLKGINSERIADIKEIKMTLKQNSEDHRQFAQQLTAQSARLVALEAERREKREDRVNKIGWYLALFLGGLGLVGTFSSYFF